MDSCKKGNGAAKREIIKGMAARLKWVVPFQPVANVCWLIKTQPT
jgi:hypothetical protein